jgi:hypothetical protein
MVSLRRAQVCASGQTSKQVDTDYGMKKRIAGGAKK